MSTKKYNWNEIITQFQNSGLSQVEFCRQNQLNAKYLNLQLSKRRKIENPSITPFVKVISSTAQVLSNSPSMSVKLSIGQHTLTINQPNPKWLSDFCKEFSQ